MTSRYDYDLFVIGGGSGGVRAARVSAAMGARVAIAEEYRFGGTCVIRGCIPKKLFVYASRFPEDFADAAGFGWTIGEARFDWPTLVANKDREIARLESIYRTNVEAAGAGVIADRAVLKDPHTVHLVKAGRDVTAERILVATGGRPSRNIGVPGAELCITSNEAFHLERLPERVVVAGGGYIAVEFAGIFCGLGVDTTLVYRGPRILRGFDQDLRDAAEAGMRARGIRLELGQVFARVERAGEALRAVTNRGTVLDTDAVMLAIGREPNTVNLGLETAGVALGRKGEILVDEYSRSNVASIYAIGDVTNRLNLTPVAIHEAMCFARTVFGGEATVPDHELVATAVFGQPELGTVGMSEDAALAAGRAIDVYKSAFRALRHTLTGRDERMMMKLVVDRGTGRVLGVHVAGEGAAEMAQLAAIPMKMGATKADFDRTVAVHPTAAEELVTMRTKSYSREPQPNSAL